MRCCALAEEFEARGWHVEWHPTIEVPWLAQSVGQASCTVKAPVGGPLEQAQNVDADVVVVDSCSLDPSYRQILLKRGLPVVAIVEITIRI
jgi:hypothetical protein